ncbi:unnamed protein product, partial [Iphiclides podalirius]
MKCRWGVAVFGFDILLTWPEVMATQPEVGVSDFVLLDNLTTDTFIENLHLSQCNQGHIRDIFVRVIRCFLMRREALAPCQSAVEIFHSGLGHRYLHAIEYKHMAQWAAMA